MPREKFDVMVEDAERIMGLRLSVGRNWASDGEYDPPKLLERPPHGDPMRIYAEHILSLRYPVVETIPGMYISLDELSEWDEEK